MKEIKSLESILEERSRDLELVESAKSFIQLSSDEGLPPGSVELHENLKAMNDNVLVPSFSSFNDPTTRETAFELAKEALDETLVTKASDYILISDAVQSEFEKLINGLKAKNRQVNKASRDLVYEEADYEKVRVALSEDAAHFRCHEGLASDLGDMLINGPANATAAASALELDFGRAKAQFQEAYLTYCESGQFSFSGFQASEPANLIKESPLFDNEQFAVYALPQALGRNLWVWSHAKAPQAARVVEQTTLTEEVKTFASPSPSISTTGYGLSVSFIKNDNHPNSALAHQATHYADAANLLKGYQLEEELGENIDALDSVFTKTVEFAETLYTRFESVFDGVDNIEQKTALIAFVQSRLLSLLYSVFWIAYGINQHLEALEAFNKALKLSQAQTEEDDNQ